jgi:hypothetical protein
MYILASQDNIPYTLTYHCTQTRCLKSKNIYLNTWVLSINFCALIQFFNSPKWRANDKL